MSWPTVKLGEISEKVDYGITASAENILNGPRFLRITDLQDGSVDWSTVPSCRCSKAEEEKYKLDAGDIVFARTGATTGKSYLISETNYNSVFASYLIRVRPKKIVDSSYLAHFFKSGRYWLQIEQMSDGAAQPGVNSTKLKELILPLPPLEEQKRIAAILDKADTIRRKRQQAIELCDQFLRSVFLDMFGDPVTNPNGWPEKQLIDVAAVRSGVTKGKKFNGKQTVKIPYMRVANVQDGHIALEDVQDIEVLLGDAEKHKLLTGDLLLTEGGDPDKLGRGAVWQGEVADCIHQNHIFCVRAKLECVHPEFLSAQIGSQRGKRYFLRVGKQTTGIATINKTVLSAYPTLLPPLELQHKYVSLLNNARQFARRRAISTSQLDKLMSSATQRAFKGELS